MDCPRTGTPLKEIEVDGVKVEISEGCGGVFFDNFELKKFDELDEKGGEELAKQMQQHSNKVDLEQRLNCPKCADTVMMRHFFSIKQNVEVDECPQCGGIWLDAGELAGIREQYDTEEEREKAAEAFVGEVFNSPEIEAMRQKSEEDLQKAKRFAKMFKWICPTAYIPGKQSWGAF